MWKWDIYKPLPPYEELARRLNRFMYDDMLERRKIYDEVTGDDLYNIQVHQYMDNSTRVRIIYLDDTAHTVTRIIDVTGMKVSEAYEFVVKNISHSDVKKISKEEVDAIDAVEGKVRRRYLYAYVHSPECFECTEVRLGID